MSTLTTTSKTPQQFESGDILVGESGGVTTILDAARSSAMPGLWTVETEHGFLYLDPDLTFEVLADSAATTVSELVSPKIVPLDEPLTTEQIRQRLDEHGRVSGVIAVGLDALINGNDIEDHMDQVAEYLVGSPLLMEINETVVGVSPDGYTLFIEVSGDPSALLDDEA